MVERASESQAQSPGRCLRASQGFRLPGCRRRFSVRLPEEVAHDHSHPLWQRRQAAAQVVLNGLSMIGVFEDRDKAFAEASLPDPKEIGTARSTAASGGTCKGDLPLKTPQRGSGKSEQLQGGESGPDFGTITSLRQPPPAAPAKDGFGRFTVSAACCADLFWTDRGSLPLSTPWPWYRPVPLAAVPIPPCPATHGRRA